MASVREIAAVPLRKIKQRPGPTLLMFGTHAPLAVLFALFLLFLETGGQRDWFAIMLLGTPIVVFMFVWTTSHGLLAVVDFAEKIVHPREIIRKAVRVLPVCAGWALPFSLVLCRPLFDSASRNATIWPGVLLLTMVSVALLALYLVPFAIYRSGSGSWRREAVCFAFSICGAAPFLLHLLLT